MRTTVTLDPDTELLLKDQARKTGESFKQVLNDAIRRGIRQGSETRHRSVTPLFKSPFPPELQAANFNRIADEWDDRETLQELNR